MTYPNVLVMGYLKETRQLTPEWRMKLETAINAGWQRLLTFQTKDGGFEWYGRDPGDVRLTAYGVLELTDMNKVYPIDTRVIERAVRFLEGRMKDGRWGDVRVTAYVVWALREAGVKGRWVDTASGWLESQKADDPYTSALLVLATGKGAGALVDGKLTVQGEGLYHARGEAASIEATALTALARLRANRPADRALGEIIRAKDPQGGWHSTQATILAIKALLEASRVPVPAKPMKITAKINGHEVAFEIDATNYDVVQSLDISKWLVEGTNTIEAEGQGPNLQLTGRYYLPWALAPRVESPLMIETTYDRTQLTRADVLTASVKMSYTGPGTFMVIADLGIPPGFNVDAESFEVLLRAKTIDKYAIAGRQVTLYFGRVTKGQVIEFSYRLRPRFPVRAQSPRSTVYEYYTPQNEGSGGPTRLEVAEK